MEICSMNNLPRTPLFGSFNILYQHCSVKLLLNRVYDWFLIIHTWEDVQYVMKANSR